MHILHEEKYHDLTIKIYQDEDAESPREWDNLGKMICFHDRYELGDKHTQTRHELKSTVERDDVLSFPLYLYDHSGITMRCAPFECRWDSGQVGHIYITHANIIKEYGTLDLKTAEKVLRGEVKTYDDHLTGNVYGYTVEDAAGEQIDSCWGYIGDYDGKYSAVSNAKDYINHVTNKGKTDHKGQYLMPFVQAKG